MEDRQCKVIISGNDCNKRASFIVRHKEHPINRSFPVCNSHIDAYKGANDFGIVFLIEELKETDSA